MDDTAIDLNLDVQFAVDQAGLPDAEDFGRWTRDTLAAGAGAGRYRRAELTVRIVDAAESASLNQGYRHKQGATNVLAFPLDTPPPAEFDGVLFGDVVICAPVVAAEAVTQRKQPQAHWAHMLVHGVMHLLGYDHQSAEQADAMERRETAILTALGFPDPYCERRQNDDPADAAG